MRKYLYPAMLVLSTFLLTSCSSKQVDLPSSNIKEKPIEIDETEEYEEVTFSDLTYDPTNGTISGKVKNNTNYFIDSVQIRGTLEEHETNGYGEDETHEVSYTNSLYDANVMAEPYGICHIGKGEEKDFAFKLLRDKDEVSKFSTPKIDTSKTVIIYRGKEDVDADRPVYLAQDNEYKMELTKNGDRDIEGVTIENTSEYQWESLNVSLEYHNAYSDTLEIGTVNKMQIDKGATVTFTSDDMKRGERMYDDVTQILYVTFEPRAQ